MRADGYSRFWITGLPRSRTAWFAVAMRAAGQSCFHELTAETRHFAELKARWTEGNSDSACGLFADRILEEIGPRTLIVERPVEEVLGSLSAVFGRDMGGLRAPLEHLADRLRLKHPLIKRVRFADLEDRDALVEAAEWLAPGSGEQVASLMNMKIEVTRGRALSLMTSPHTLWHLERAA